MKTAKLKQVLIIIATVIACLAVIACVTAVIVRAVGRNRLQNQAKSFAPDLTTAETEEITPEEKTIWKEGWVKYHDRVYEYNDDLITFLFMGIDKRDESVKEVAEGTNGGQADALFLLVLNPDDESLKVIAINRNAMVPVDVYDEMGSYVNTVTAQINTQHGFGNGLEESCEYQVKAVDNLMYNVPIHGYFAINMKAVETITEAVGGVDVVVYENVTTTGDHKQIFTAGESLHMDGKTAYKYVTVRDTAVEGSANGRLERQKQYLNEVISKIKMQTREDITTPVRLYDAISDQMVTNISADEIAYLATIAGGYDFNVGSIITLEGEYVVAEENVHSNFDEFYVDEDALKDVVINVFYREVTP